MAPLLNDPGVASAVTTRLRGSGSGAENDSLCRWLYDTFWSNVPELQLAVLLLVPSLARAHLCRAMSRKPLAGFEAVLLALYAHAASQHGAGEVETRDHVTPEPGKDFGTSKREPVGKIEQVQSIVLSHDCLLLDYICTQGDLALIDFIKEIPCEPTVEVVLIDDAFVERKWMECLFQPNTYLGDEVIDYYINLIKAQKHLKCRSGGRVHIENAFQFNFLKRDGDVEIKTEELYAIKDMTHICSAERRVLLYLDHDMVFILINIRETHWYLVVIHARNMEIQVLDSLGTTQDHKDLTDSIKGLQRQIDMISQRKELKDHKWPDLQVASWSLREIDMGYAKQTDSSSCGLFLLNYIEYWTRDELSDSFTQDDMSHFREKWLLYYYLQT
ncbi:putative ubiquitin-like-specific protease 1B [Zea mays]|uniref:Putative ubiquitin-like-specific protease 1B n=1 Tax=Zea mays TaxID=4577 RepID=A0A317Y4G2_MAIZE|nr:putative ubiquitin-like-specific protease 1B [Zea mays]